MPVALALALACAIAAPEGPPAQVEVDLFVFGQGDEGGNPHQAESFVYTGLRGAGRYAIDERWSFKVNATVALISHDEAQPVPPSVENVTVTSASPTLVTLDALVGADVKLGEVTTLGAAAFYHHQYGFFVWGGDLTGSFELAGGDTLISWGYNFRGALNVLRFWDGTEGGEDWRLTHRALAQWTQTLSPSVRVALGLQFVKQEGWLGDVRQFVTFLDGVGQPKLYEHERLPRSRTRGQVNLRVRWTPSLGLGFGLDLSGYVDDWGLKHVATEPSVELPLGRLRLKLWYRLALQEGTDYYVARAFAYPENGFLTMDSDLADLVIHSPGLLLRVPLTAPGESSSWVLRLSAYGFYRDDGIFAAGGHAGAETAW